MNGYITYYGYFGWLALLWYISRKQHYFVTKQDHCNEKIVTRYTWVFIFLAAAPLVYFAAKRGNIGDTYNYRKGFENAPTAFSAIPGYVNGIKKDKAFYFFVAFWRTVLGYRPVVYFGIIALFQILCFTRTIRKYTPYALTSFFVFFASTDYISFMQNGVRQFVAVCIIFLCSDWIFEKKYTPAIMAVLVASMFHQSALLMIPVIFIVQGEPWNKSTLLFMMLALVTVFFVDRFTNILDNLLSETQYSNVINDWTSGNDNGTNPLRVLVYSVPAILSVLGLPYIRQENDKVINVCTNMAVISAGLYIISMATSGIFVGRLPIYASMYANCILLPWEIDKVFNKQSSKVLQQLMIVSFIIFYIYQVHYTWGLI